MSCLRPPLWVGDTGEQMPNELLNTQQAAVELHVSPSRILKLIEARRLKAEKKGRDWLIRPEDLESVRERPTGRPRNPRLARQDPITLVGEIGTMSEGQQAS